MWTLTVCAGMWIGICGQINTHVFPDKETCYEARDHISTTIEDGWAVCVPIKQLTMPKLPV